MQLFKEKFEEITILPLKEGSSIIFAPRYNFPLYGRRISKIENGDEVIKRRLNE